MPTFNEPVIAISNSGFGVKGVGNNVIGVHGSSGNLTGVFGESSNGFGAHGQSQGNIGVHGRSTNNTGVFGLSDTFFGVHGKSTSSTGVVAESGTGFGAHGISPSNIGVFGQSTSSTGVFGLTESGLAVHGRSTNGTAVLGEGPTAGRFTGRVEVFGDFTVARGKKRFKIDHPLDPQNKYLLHSSVESSEMKNVYDGVAQLDEDGAASVDLPKWFEALNGDFRYQLTAVGQAAPNLHVAEEISENRFRIAGGERGMKVCWQVTGSRKDAWAAANPFEVEEDKPQEERGRYLQPDLYGAPEEQSVSKARMGDAPPQPPAMPPTAPPEMPQRFEPPQAPPMPPGVAAPGFGRMEEEHRRQIDELRGQIEELRRGSLEEEIDELRRQVKKLRRRR
jgi:hypothetical protein